MSRVRSKLDSLLEDTHSSAGFRHDSPHGTPGEKPADIDRIRASLDRLAGSLQSIAASPSHQRAASPAIATPRPSAEHEQRPGRGPAYPDFHRRSEAGPDIGEQLNALRRELLQAMEALGRDRIPSELRDEMRHVAEAVARLEQRDPGAPDAMPEQFQALSGQLHELRNVIDDLAGRPAPHMDMENVNRSIEDGYAQLAARMEESLASLASQLSRPRGDSEVHSQLGSLSQHVGAIHDAMDSLPARLSITAMETRLDELTRSIEDLAASDERSLLRHFGEIDERLDEVTRALVAISASPDGGDALDRIEARIATLAKTVEAMAEDVHASAGGPDDGAEAFASEIKTALEAIDNRLSGMSAASAGTAGELDGIASQIMQLSEKLDNMQALGAAAGELAMDDGELLGRLDEIVSRLDKLDESAAASAGNARNASSADETGEILAMMKALGERMDTLTRPESAKLPEAEQLAALEGQLAGIVAQLETISASGIDFAPIAERLDSIEQQVANSRDIAIDVASQAAERAAGLVSGASGIDPSLVEALRTALAELDAKSREFGSRNEEALKSVHEALSAIAERLGDIETRMGGESRLAGVGRVDGPGSRADDETPVAAGIAEQAVAIYPEPEMAEAELAQHDGDAVGEADIDRLAAEVEAGLRDRAVSNQETQEAARLEADPGEPGHGETLTELPPVEDAPSLDMEELPPAEVDDVPLEPGSGAPDLAALVRQASARRKAGEKAGTAHGTSDLIAAARRAAQAAAEEAAAIASEQRAERGDKPGKGLAGLKSLLARHRKLLLLGSAIVVIAMAAVPVASRFLGSSDSAGPRPEVAAPATVQDDVDKPGPEAAGGATTESIAPPQENIAPATPAPGTMAPGPQSGEAVSGSSTGDSARAVIAPSETMPDRPQEAPGTDIDATAPGAPASQGQASAAPVPGEAITRVPMPPAEVGNAALRQAAASGEGAALFEVARRYTDGDGVERDLALARQWYEHSARAGFAPAQYRLGNFFEKGHGVAADVDQAVLWYRRAAEQGNALAMHNLAVLFTSGLVGGKPDMETAIGWFMQAAELGVKDSQVNLGILYTRGLGTDENLVEAYKWFAVAARAGDSDAAGKRDMLASAMRPDQLEKARGLAELWKPAALDPAVNSAETRPEWMDEGGRAATTQQGGNTAALSAHDMVGRVQLLLARHGFDPGPADGLMGQKTREAVRAFQADAGLPVNGAITGELLKALEAGMPEAGAA